MSTNVTIDRGSDATFTATFLDQNGAPVTPASATLNIAYWSLGVRIKVALTMTNIGSAWTAVWSTIGIPGGIIYWSIVSTSPNSATDGTFLLTANPANPGP